MLCSLSILALCQCSNSLYPLNNLKSSKVLEMTSLTGGGQLGSAEKKMSGRAKRVSYEVFQKTSPQWYSFLVIPPRVQSFRERSICSTSHHVWRKKEQGSIACLFPRTFCQVPKKHGQFKPSLPSPKWNQHSILPSGSSPVPLKKQESEQLSCRARRAFSADLSLLTLISCFRRL